MMLAIRNRGRHACVHHDQARLLMKSPKHPLSTAGIAAPHPNPRCPSRHSYPHFPPRIVMRMAASARTLGDGADVELRVLDRQLGRRHPEQRVAVVPHGRLGRREVRLGVEVLDLRRDLHTTQGRPASLHKPAQRGPECLCRLTRVASAHSSPPDFVPTPGPHCSGPMCPPESLFQAPLSAYLACEVGGVEPLDPVNARLAGDEAVPEGVLADAHGTHGAQTRHHHLSNIQSKQTKCQHAGVRALARRILYPTEPAAMYHQQDGHGSQVARRHGVHSSKWARLTTPYRCALSTNRM